MDSPVMEDHIKYEAEESEQLTDHVWEEVIIEETQVPSWRQDLEAEEDTSADVTMESTASESTESSVVAQNSAAEDRTAVDESEMDSTEPPLAPDPQPQLQPIVTSVTSLARPVPKVVNLNSLKLLPKGSFVNIGNKKMRLVTLSGDKKLIAGKVVTMTNSDNKLITGKVVSLGNKMMPSKVVSMAANNNIPTGNIINNKVVPAKVVSIANSKLKPIAPNNKEVTIYITGMAGDKVQIRNSSRTDSIHVEEKEALEEGEVEPGWRSDHIDACLPADSAPEDESDGFLPEAEAAEGHFLLEGTQSYSNEIHVCHICDRHFTQLKYLLSHQQTHILAEPVSCDSCDKHFKRRYDLLRHKRRAHAQDILYECDVCHKTFSDRNIANRHRLIHTDEFKYCCEVCNRPFKYVHDLKRHRSIHFDEKPFDCQICFKKFKHKSNLKTHQATHYSEKPYSCTLCDKRFHQKGNLKTHLIVHTGEMPFVCTLCTKRFHTRSGLLNHSYSHSEEKPFQCDVCDKTFNWKSGLLTHQQTHRQKVIQEDVQVIEIGPIPVD